VLLFSFPQGGGSLRVIEHNFEQDILLEKVPIGGEAMDGEEKLISKYFPYIIKGSRITLSSFICYY
jgi:hypothetical protein